MMKQWFEINEVNQELIKFVVIITEYNNQLIIIKNKKRGAWEFPGGTREPGEALLFTASRELFEETGAFRFDIEAFGIYQMDGSYGMVYFAEVKELGDLPNYEIDEIKFVNNLPEGMSFGEMFYVFYDKWSEYTSKNSQKQSINIKDIIGSSIASKF
jgi:8-oxo-dGTP diphosphatase